MDAPRMLGITCDQELAADRIGRLAVHAGAGLCAGCIKTEALGIDRGGHIAGALEGTVHIVTDLVHTYDKKDMPGEIGRAHV